MLTAHFSLREMCASGTAIRLGIKNEPSEEVINRLQQLCEHVLEPLRQRFGVIRITSGYRCERLNKAVGGVKNSQHRLGEAAAAAGGGGYRGSHCGYAGRTQQCDAKWYG